MSRTEIYIFRKEGYAEYYADVINGSRGALKIWLMLEKQYLPSLSHPGCIKPHEYYSRFAYNPKEEDSKLKRKEVWDLVREDSPLTENQRIVLKSTFDWAVCKIEDIPKLIKEYRKFDGYTSLPEQAMILQKILDDPECKDVIAVAITQTSIIDGWDEIGDPDPVNPEERLPYNILTGNKHFYLFND